jgi:hypothetical protein
MAIMSAYEWLIAVATIGAACAGGYCGARFGEWLAEKRHPINKI